MRIGSISVQNVPPVHLFEVEGLSDVVVIAGPNGVGKTRLIQRVINHIKGASPHADVAGTIEATSKDEIAAWGKATLDVSTQEDMALLQSTLQRNRRRRNWRSSLVNIESDRAIQKIEPLKFSWDLPDPDEEDVSWDQGIGFMRNRYQDTIHSLFRMIESQKQKIANRAIDLRRQGHESMNLGFDDPMQPFKDIFSQLVPPKELADLSAREQRLEYHLNHQTFEFSTLSSGEREVVNVAFDFLLRRPQDCVVFFDEPELHLHPELSFRLIRTLQNIGKNNQIVLSTHSPSVITASLDRSVIFLSPPSADEGEGPTNQAIPVTEDDETHQALRLLGHSIGIVALGRRIVLIEGSNSSVDKQTYESIVHDSHLGLVMVPSGSKGSIRSFQSVYESVLSRSIWGVEFFMLYDGDSDPAATVGGAAAAKASGRLRVLPRYHIENYFLDEYVWAEAFSDMEDEDSWLRSPDKIREAFRSCAESLVSYATSLAASSHLRLSTGNVDVMPKECHGRSVDEVKKLVLEEVVKEQERIMQALDGGAAESWIEDYYTRLGSALRDDSDEWKRLIPGKPLLAYFASRAGLRPESRAKTLYLKTALRSERDPFRDVRNIFEQFASAS